MSANSLGQVAMRRQKRPPGKTKAVLLKKVGPLSRVKSAKTPSSPQRAPVTIDGANVTSLKTAMDVLHCCFLDSVAWVCRGLRPAQRPIQLRVRAMISDHQKENCCSFQKKTGHLTQSLDCSTERQKIHCQAGSVLR